MTQDLLNELHKNIIETEIYNIENNTILTNGFPWIDSIVSGVTYKTCSRCENVSFSIDGSVSVTLKKNKGTKWSDILGIGAFPMLFIVSERFVESFLNEKLGELFYEPIQIVGKLPKKLEQFPMPKYYFNT